MSNGVLTAPNGTAPAADVPGAYPMARPSPHLSWSELSCHDGTPYPPIWWERAVDLAAEFEAIRAACGDHPLLVLSAYRTPDWNKRCGGVERSQHLEGRALDVQIRAGWPEQRFFSVVRDLALRTEHGVRVSKIRGIGRYPARGFLHFDIRPQDRLDIWAGKHAHYVPRG